jgi:hypothetical protein
MMVTVAFNKKKPQAFLPAAFGSRVFFFLQYVFISYRRGALSAGAAIAIIPVVIKAAYA